MIVSSKLRLAAALGASGRADAIRLVRMYCHRTLGKKAAAASLFAVLALGAGISSAAAGGEPIYSPIARILDFGHEPNDLPPRFRTNCSIQNGRFYCAYRCGFGYEFFYCSAASFGCCHVADGYCDYRGFLRCRP
jgi:hypothetical protein